MSNTEHAPAAVLERVRQDINWMLNERKFLDPSVFNYLDDAIAKTESAPLTLDAARAKVEAMVPKGAGCSLDECWSRFTSGGIKHNYDVWFQLGDAALVATVPDLPSALAWFERVISERGAK